MKKKPYKKPEVKEVKLTIEDTLLASCRASAGSRVNVRRGGNCNSCRTTFMSS